MQRDLGVLREAGKDFDFLDGRCRPMKRMLSVVTLVLATAAVSAATPGVRPAMGAADAAATIPARTTYTVTLVTGDVVTVTANGPGCPLVSVRPASRGRTLWRECGRDGHVRVIPTDAAALVRRVLDPALFDVTVLIRNGYDDRRSADTPLIVQYAGTANARTAPFGAALRAQRSLSSIQALAGHQPKAESATLRRALPALAAPGAGGVRRIWLDRRVQATAEPEPSTVDANLTQIGAPEAWQAGYTGAGVRVAVLDTGVDATHPDLARQVTETANFTDDADAVDPHGHGTHVAATIAGTGAASNGRHRGVAPDSRLLVGKVLNAYGFGEESWLIAAMEWAAPRADVVNMSLGTLEPSDGNDPLSVAVDALSYATGTLFVAAAGNSGPWEATVGAPGAASTALTVGAIDARSTAATGTSMATPHAAGAAAILKQRYPSWRGEQLKAGLVASADPAQGGDAYAIGGGRVDIPSAMGAPAAGRDVVNVGILAYPQFGATDATLSWLNNGSEPVTLALAISVTDRYGQAPHRQPRAAKSGRVLRRAADVHLDGAGEPAARYAKRGVLRVRRCEQHRRPGAVRGRRVDRGRRAGEPAGTEGPLRRDRDGRRQHAGRRPYRARRGSRRPDRGGYHRHVRRRSRTAGDRHGARGRDRTERHRPVLCADPATGGAVVGGSVRLGR